MQSRTSYHNIRYIIVGFQSYGVVMLTVGPSNTTKVSIKSQAVIKILHVIVADQDEICKNIPRNLSLLVWAVSTQTQLEEIHWLHGVYLCCVAKACSNLKHFGTEITLNVIWMCLMLVYRHPMTVFCSLTGKAWNVYHFHQHLGVSIWKCYNQPCVSELKTALVSD